LVEITPKKVLVICLISAIILGLSAPLILSWNQPIQDVMYLMYLEEKKTYSNQSLMGFGRSQHDFDSG